MAEIAGEVRPVRRWPWLRLPRRLCSPAVWGPALAVALAIVSLLFLGAVQYRRLARMTDRLLAEGPFSSSTDILAAPETIATGDALAPENAATRQMSKMIFMDAQRFASEARGFARVVLEAIIGRLPLRFIVAYR